MKLSIPPAYLRSIRFAAVAQLLAVLLTSLVDDDGSFLPMVAVGWFAFWLGVVALAATRSNPTMAELIAVRYGPMGVFLGVFVAGQYL